MSRIDFFEFRNLIIEMVLHTDMSKHFIQLRAIKTALQQSKLRLEGKWIKKWKKLKYGRLIATPGPLKQLSVDLDRKQVLSLLLHSCDISHPAKHWYLHHEWTSRYQEELFRQGDQEAKCGFNCSPLCNRKTTMVAQSQINFIESVVQPTFLILGEVTDLFISQHSGGEKPRPLNRTASVSRLDEKEFCSKPWLYLLTFNKAKWINKREEL